MRIQQLNDNIYISDQVNIIDIEILSQMGIKSIINNRPDNEADGQPSSNELMQAARLVNIDYYYLPITPDKYPVKKTEELTILLNSTKKPTVMFCRTGNRSANLWALAQVNKHESEYIINTTRELGFDTSGVLNNGFSSH